MIYALGAILLVMLAYGPFLWVKYVFWRHSNTIDDMPGTGGELAQHFIERFELEGVTVNEGEAGQDHYNPEKKAISLSPMVFKGQSLTAVAVATHEIGHAIQFFRDEPVSHLRSKYMGKVATVKMIGTIVMVCLPIAAFVLKTPYLFFFTVIVGVVTMLASTLMYVAILPEEYDASFNKALPILQEGYIPEEQIPAVRQILRAAALTYVAGALADIVRLWRWLRYFR